MDKKILEHKGFVETEIVRISKISRNQLSSANGEFSRSLEAQKLAKYNDDMIKNFQHERQIHLFVTFFFGGLLIISLTISSLISVQFNDIFAKNSANLIAVASSFTLSLILSILEAFYIAYYYRLENRIAKLYPLSRKIYDLQG